MCELWRHPGFLPEEKEAWWLLKSVLPWEVTRRSPAQIRWKHTRPWESLGAKWLAWWSEWSCPSSPAHGLHKMQEMNWSGPWRTHKSMQRTCVGILGCSHITSHKEEEASWGWQNGSGGQDTCCHPWVQSPEVGPWDPHGGKSKLSPESHPLTSTRVPTNIQNE